MTTPKPLTPDRDTTWMRDDCGCRVTSPDGDGCYLSADYKNGLCAHCEGHRQAEPAMDALLRLSTHPYMAAPLIAARDMQAIARAALATTPAERPHHDPTDHDCKGGVPGDLFPLDRTPDPAEAGLREAAYLWAETPDNDPFIHEVEDNLLNAVTADRIARNDHAARLREDRS